MFDPYVNSIFFWFLIFFAKYREIDLILSDFIAWNIAKLISSNNLYNP